MIVVCLYFFARYIYVEDFGKKSTIERNDLLSDFSTESRILTGTDDAFDSFLKYRDTHSGIGERRTSVESLYFMFTTTDNGFDFRR